MSSVYGLLSRTGAATEGVSPAADAFLADTDDDPDGYAAAIVDVGGAVTSTPDGYVEVTFPTRVLRELRRYTRQPLHRLAVYTHVGAAPQYLHDAVADLSADLDRQRPCLGCREQGRLTRATETLYGQVVLCADCRPAYGAGVLHAPPTLPCPRCGVDVADDWQAQRQREEVGRFTGLCQPCYLSRAVEIPAPDLVWWVSPEMAEMLDRR